LLEIFWRIQLIPFVAVTPDIHFVFNPSDNPARARIVVVGIRLQLDF
jgi:carbohydrate-selective porin OprB